MQDERGNRGATPQEKPPRRRWLRLVLVVSVAINLLLLGLLAGGAMRAWQEPAQPAMAEMRTLWHVLPAETRNALRREFRGRDGAGVAPEFAPQRGMGQDGGGQGIGPGFHGGGSPALAELLRTEPFDDDAFAAALERARKRRGERAQRAERALARQLAALPAEERAAIAARLEERLDRRPRREGQGGR